jgi:hypothetical protein
VKHGAILLIRHRGLEHSLVQIRIELLILYGGVNPLQPVLLQRLHQNGFRHFEPIVQHYEVRVCVGQGGGGDGGEGAVKVVDRLDEVAGEALEGEVFRGRYFTFCAVLEVAEVGY